MSEVLGRYELIDKLAAGGMGEVFFARQLGLEGAEKFLVIKTLLPDFNDDRHFIKMFFDEARIAAMLSHPNIAQIYELGEAGGRYFIAMEYVHGQTLRATYRAAELVPGAMGLGLKCRIIAAAAQALDYAHNARNTTRQPLGLIHRDVTPNNIMVTFAGTVKLVDFGLAKANDKLVRTATGIIKGTYAYMSPEQAHGLTLDPRSDIYSLGIVLHELLTGQRLFLRPTPLDTLRAVVGAPIPIPSEVVKGIPRALDAIVAKALARKVEERYPSCRHLEADLEGVIARLRLPATAPRLAAFMKGLFPEAAAPDAPLRSLERRLTSSEETTAPAASNPHALPPAPPAKGEPAMDPQQLASRLAACGASAQTWGLFLNAVEAAALKRAGPVARAELRKAAEWPREWVDSIQYPTRELLRILWRGIELLAPRCGGSDAAFALVGDEAFAALRTLPASTALVALPPFPSATALLEALIPLIGSLIQPGSRLLTDCTGDAALVVFKGEVLPLQLYAALLRAAFLHCRGKAPQMSWERTMPDRVELKLRW